MCRACGAPSWDERGRKRCPAAERAPTASEALARGGLDAGGATFVSGADGGPDADTVVVPRAALEFVLRHGAFDDAGPVLELQRALDGQALGGDGPAALRAPLPSHLVETPAFLWTAVALREVVSIRPMVIDLRGVVTVQCGRFGLAAVNLRGGAAYVLTGMPYAEMRDRFVEWAGSAAR